MYNILRMEYLPASGHLVTNHQNQDSPLGEDGEVLLPRILRIGRIVSYARLGARQKPNKPLGEDEGGTPEDREVLTTDRTDKSCGGRNGSKSLLLSPGLRPCSPMRMLSHESKLPCLSIHIRLVCRWQTRKATKQNSCPWQYKMSLHRRLLTVTSNL